jgi:aminoglycoside phosphotransferase (APT) family kinase protein
MASTAPVIDEYETVIRGLVVQLRVHAPALNAMLRKIATVRASGAHLHPTWNLRVFHGDRPLFLRVLIRNDAVLRKERRNSVALLFQLQQRLGGRPAFAVPHVLESGESGGVFWDLETLVKGRHLPWSWTRPSGLTPHLDQVKPYVRAFDALASMDLTLPVEDWAKQRKSAGRFTQWAAQREDLSSLPLDEVAALQRRFFAGSSAVLVPTHPDLTHRNILCRGANPPALLDWDGAHLGVDGEMFGRHWLLMCSEPRWQEEVVRALGRKRGAEFWEAFHVYAWFRGIDQIHHELEIFHGRSFESVAQLSSFDPKRGRVVDQMLKALWVLARCVGGPPPGPGGTGRRLVGPIST